MLFCNNYFDGFREFAFSYLLTLKSKEPTVAL